MLVYRESLENTWLKKYMKILKPFVSMETDLSSVVQNYDQLGVNGVNLVSVSVQL